MTDYSLPVETPLKDASKMIAGILVFAWIEHLKTHSSAETTVGEVEALFAPHIERLLRDKFEEREKLYDGRIAVLPKTEKHARDLIAVASGCYPNILNLKT